MKRESRLAIELWDMLREHVPTGKRREAALTLLTALQDYGMERDELCDVVDDDVHLIYAFYDLFGEEDEDKDDSDIEQDDE